MLRQIINGSVKRTVMVSGSQAHLQALSLLLAGKTEIWDKKTQGGTNTAVAVPLNAFKFSVGKKDGFGLYLSAAVSLPHLKRTKNMNDVSSAVKGIWDADFNTATKCEYCNGIGNSSRG